MLFKILLTLSSTFIVINIYYPNAVKNLCLNSFPWTSNISYLNVAQPDFKPQFGVERKYRVCHTSELKGNISGANRDITCICTWLDIAL